MDALTEDDLEFLRKTFALCRFHRHLGFELKPLAKGRVEVIARYSADLDQGMGFLHGGVYASLLDTATYYAALSHYGRAGRLPLTQEYKVNLLSPAKQEDVTAVAEVVKTGRLVAVAEAKLRSASGKLVAVGMASFLIPPEARAREE
jgi:uncharacterized protein (TIGR00369 family)